MKIYIWDNTGTSNYHIGRAISEDGKLLASHISSTLDFLKQDMGLTPQCDWHHDEYKAHAPDGYELIFVDRDDPRLLAAIELSRKDAEL